MYDYRNMSPAERQAIVAHRRRRNFPWHGPPHLEAAPGFRLITGVCFEHEMILRSCARLKWFEEEILRSLREWRIACAAWCILPNHYHALLQIDDIKAFSKCLGQFHGRTSYIMNEEDDACGRRVWYRSQDRAMRSDRHFFTSINYIHNNPVKHGYVKKWQDWPFSSIHWYLQNKGRPWLLDAWREYPLLDFGKSWDVF